MLYSTTEYYLIYLTYVYIDADDTLSLTMYASDNCSAWLALYYDRNPCKHIYNTFITWYWRHHILNARCQSSSPHTMLNPFETELTSLLQVLWLSQNIHKHPKSYARVSFIQHHSHSQ